MHISSICCAKFVYISFMYVSISLEKGSHLSNYTYIEEACLRVLTQNGTVREYRNSAPDMLKVIHVSSHSDRVRLYIMYLRQISLKNIDIHVLYVARKWVIQCVQRPLKLAYAFIIERLLESSIFRTQNILGPLTVFANRK